MYLQYACHMLCTGVQPLKSPSPWALHAQQPHEACSNFKTGYLHALILPTEMVHAARCGTPQKVNGTSISTRGKRRGKEAVRNHACSRSLQQMEGRNLFLVWTYDQIQRSKEVLKSGSRCRTFVSGVQPTLCMRGRTDRVSDPR